MQERNMALDEESETVTNNIEIVDIVDNEDGSSTVVFDMSNDLIKLFVEIGLRKVIMDTVANTVQDEAEHEHS